MSITGMISGIVMLFTPVEEVNIANKIYKGTVMAGKIIERPNKEHGEHLLMKKDIRSQKI